MLISAVAIVIIHKSLRFEEYLNYILDSNSLDQCKRKCFDNDQKLTGSCIFLLHKGFGEFCSAGLCILHWPEKQTKQNCDFSSNTALDNIK